MPTCAYIYFTCISFLLYIFYMYNNKITFYYMSVCACVCVRASMCVRVCVCVYIYERNE